MAYDQIVGKILLVLLCTTLAACSFVFVREPSGAALKDPRVPLECTSSRSLPLADLVIGAVAGGLIAATTYTAIQSVNDDCPACSNGKKPAALAAFLVVSPWWISSAVGFSDT